MRLLPASRLVMVGCALAAQLVWADDTRVTVQADVVYASTQPGTVEPSLAAMQTALGSRVKYATMKKLSSHKLELSSSVARVELPNKKSAEFTLVSLKANVAQVHAKVPPVDTTYVLGKDKSLYIQAGAHDGGELWLVLAQPK